MLIGIDATQANRDHKSGTEWYSYYLIRWLAKIDSKNQYVLYTNKPLKDGLLDLSTEQYFVNNDNQSEKIKFDKDGYQVIKSPYNNFRAKVLNWPWSFFWTLGRLSLEMLFKRPDVLFIPAHGLPFFSPKKTITTIHDIAFERDNNIYAKDYPGLDDRKMKYIVNFFVKIFTLGKYKANSYDYLKWSTRYASRKAKKIITVSDFSKQEIIKTYGMAENKVKVIYNGYNALLYKRREDEKKIERVLEKYGIIKPYFFYVGRLERKKNTPTLINAFAIFKENNDDAKEKLVLAGDASFGFDEAKYIIEEYGLDAEIIIPGWVEEEDLPYIYSGAKAFIFPSKYEGFGIPIIQAMACGVPVVASNIPVLKEIAGEAAIFFDPNDKKNMAKVMTEVANNKELREKLIKNGYKRVKDFSWEKSAEVTLKEINGL